MSHQDDASGRNFDIQQLQWALRHGQKVDGLENIMISNQPVIMPDNDINKNIEENSISLDQEILSACKIAELEWTNSLEGYESKLQAYIEQMQHHILGKLDEYFAYLNEQLQYKDQILRQEVALLLSKVAALESSQGSEEEVSITQWRERIEERQANLIEDMGYIQYVVEEFATRPQCIEAQQKLRETFFIREISALKKEITSVCRNIKLYNDLVQPGINVSNEDQTLVYKKRRKRRH